LLLLPLKYQSPKHQNSIRKHRYANSTVVEVTLIKIKTAKAVYNTVLTLILIAIHDGDFYFYQPFALY
jgi:hypothetical protein